MMRSMAIILFGLVALSGCSNDTSGIGSTERSAQSEVRTNNQWLIVDNLALGRRVTLIDPRVVPEQERLRAIATIQSTNKYDQSLQYRFYWFDQNGVQLKPDTTAWRPIKLHGNQSIQVQSVSVSENAESFKIYLREVHSN